MTDKLISAITGVDWNANVRGSIGNTKTIAEMHASCERIAVWSQELENLDQGNPAIAFVRGVQIAAQHVVACVCLGLYSAAAASIRSVLESGLYYSYFRDHPKELKTLVDKDSYYLSRSQIIDYHKLHTANFIDNQNALGLIGRLDSWYSNISAVVHGQIPGTWVTFRSLTNVLPDPSTFVEVVRQFVLGEQILHEFLLITVGVENWDVFNATAKRTLSKGLAGDVRTRFQLDRS